MSNEYWWFKYGPFNPWRRCPTRPDPGEVLLFYLRKRGIESDEQLSYLMDILNLQKSMVYNILKGVGLDSISRCRLLVQSLKIHPPLLGIDAKFYPIECHAFWWHDYGFSFEADAEGYPLMSQVILCLRSRCFFFDKSWTQQDLADACGLKKETTYRFEHDRNPLILDHMSRRAMIALVFGTLDVENEPIIFRLFGLDPQSYGVSVPDDGPVNLLPSLTDSLLVGYYQSISGFFNQYYSGHAVDILEVNELLSTLESLLEISTIVKHRISLLSLQSRCHRLISSVAREKCAKSSSTDIAVNLAEQAMALSSSSDVSELLAMALLCRAEFYYEREEYDLALVDVDRALDLSIHVQSNQKMYILACTGLIRANTAKNGMDCGLVLSFFDLSLQLCVNSLDNNFIRFDVSSIYLYKAMAFCAPPMRNAITDSVMNLLDIAQRLSRPEMIRQQVVIEVFQVQMYFSSGDYQQATEVALGALEKSRQICSRLNRNRIEKVYCQLLDTSFRGNSRLSYLGMKLRTWDYGMV